jgi:hypothetical protein
MEMRSAATAQRQYDEITDEGWMRAKISQQPIVSTTISAKGNAYNVEFILMLSLNTR